jgi:microcystin-dependent protein
MDGYLGEIRLFSFPKVPRDWAICDGSILQISTNQALASLLGNAFGGDGRTTFALPDLRGRVPVHLSSNPTYTLGTSGGIDTVALGPGNLPAHGHSVCADDAAATQVGPPGNIPAKPAKNVATDPDAPQMYGPATATALTTLDPSVVQVSGASVPHENRQPFLAINYCICTVGVYPMRP